MFIDHVSADETLGYLEYVEQFTCSYETESEVDVSQLLDSIQD